MGNRSAEFNEWFRLLFFMAIIGLEELRERLASLRVIVIDGSLAKRRLQWSRTGDTFEEWLSATFGLINNIIATLPNVKHVVFLSDMYDLDDGSDDAGLRVLECIPKACTHESRYGDFAEQQANPDNIPDPAKTFQPDQPCASVRSCDVFGLLPNRMELDRMFTEYFFGWAQKRTAETPGLSIILHGGVVRAGSGKPRALSRPYVVQNGQGVPYESRIDAPHFCRCSEGDPRLAYWGCEFSDMPQAWWSCDTDILQVMLQHVRRMARLPMSEVPEIVLIKDVPSSITYFDGRRLYSEVMHKLGQAPFNHYPTEQHPVDILSMVLALGGNDMCHPLGISPEQRMKCKGNDGIRIAYILAALATHGRLIGPVLRSTGSHIIPNSRYCRQGLPCEIFHFGVDTRRLAALVAQAQTIQMSDKCRVDVARPLYFDSMNAVMAAAARMAWAGHYYGNSHVPGYEGPRGDEVDATSGRSLFGFKIERKGDTRSTTLGKAMWADDAEVHHRWIVWGCHAQDAETPPPSPRQTNLSEAYGIDESDDDKFALKQSVLDPTVRTLDGFFRK